MLIIFKTVDFFHFINHTTLSFTSFLGRAMGRVKQCARKLNSKTRRVPPQNNDDSDRTHSDEHATPQAPPPPSG